MFSFTACSKNRSKDGFIIVAVLWILGALAALVVVYSIYVRQTAVEFVSHDEQLQAQALAAGGVELAAYQLTARPIAPPSQGRFSFREGTATVSVEFSSENSRIDLNYAPKQLLAGLFISRGVQSADALTFADHIIAWRTPLKSGATDSEAQLYQATGKMYGPRHGPFQQVDEVGMVAGLPPHLIDRVLPYLTVYSGRPEINVISAPPEVLAALPGLTPANLQLLLELRANNPQDVLKTPLGVAASYLTLQASKADRVTVDVQFLSGHRIRSQLIIFLMDDDKQPYRVLSWRDDEPSVDERDDTGMR
jgi:general secretion pathway protein K